MSSRCVEVCTKNQLYEFFAEFNATEESVRNDVQYLKEWIRKQPHLPNIEDDEWFINFLLRCKNSLEKTKKNIDGYFAARTMMPEVFQGRGECLDKMEHLLQQCCFVPALKLSPEGYRVVMFRIFDDSSNTVFDFDDLIKLGQMLIDLCLKIDYSRGVIYIFDMENVTMNFISFLFSFVKKGITLGVKTNPIRHYKVYVINSIPALEPIIGLCKRFVKKELAIKIEVWKDNPKNLISVLPKEVLPSIYGGDDASLEEQRDIWYDEVKKHRAWYLSDESNKADLSKKPADDLNKTDIFTNYGAEGSFRKICLD